jgi:hypothetical protein
VSREEGSLLQTIGASLGLTDTEQSLTNALVLQRRQVEKEKLY